MTNQTDLLLDGEGNQRSRSRMLVRKIVGITFILLGIYYLVSFSVRFIHFLEVAEPFDPVTGQQTSISDFIYYNHLTILIPAAELIAGLLCLLNNRNAWALGMIVVLSKLLSLFLFFPQDMNAVFIIFSIVYAIIYAGLLVLLLSKSFRIKYTPTKNTWMLVIGIALIVFADALKMIQF